jgi:hypothetical protein
MALSPRDRRAVTILGGLAVAAAGFFFLTRGGGEPPEEAAPPTTAPPPAVAPSPTPTGRPPRFTFFSGRDPFLPLVVAPEAAGEAPAGEAPAGEAPVGEQPVTEPSPGAEGAVTPEGGTTIGGHSVTVIDVFTQDGQQMVQVEVDGQTFTVSEGEEFSDNFRVESIQGTCASFLFGDEPFTLCEGGERK